MVKCTPSLRSQTYVSSTIFQDVKTLKPIGIRQKYIQTIKTKQTNKQKRRKSDKRELFKIINE